jgi:hypothetical protein
MAAPDAYVSHTAPGRLRLSVPACKGDVRFFQETGRRLGEMPGVIHAEGRATTGSLVIRHHGNADRLIRHAETEGLFALHPSSPPARPLTAELGDLMDGADRRLARLSGGRLSVLSVLFVVLAGSAVVQGLRGRVAAPAATLGWYALNALLLARMFERTTAFNRNNGRRP